MEILSFTGLGSIPKSRRPEGADSGGNAERSAGRVHEGARHAQERAEKGRAEAEARAEEGQ